MMATTIIIIMIITIPMLIIIAITERSNAIYLTMYLTSIFVYVIDGCII